MPTNRRYERSEHTRRQTSYGRSAVPPSPPAPTANALQLLGKPIEWDGRWIEIAVLDTGIGIPRENHRRIFDLYEQGEHGTLSLNNGVGLGLAICKQLMSVLGGKMLVESAVGTGTTFRVLLPARRRRVNHSAAVRDAR